MVNDLMDDPFKRKKLEFKLDALIRSAEETTIDDPKLKAMVKQLRQLYKTDNASFMFMMGMVIKEM